MGSPCRHCSVCDRGVTIDRVVLDGVERRTLTTNALVSILFSFFERESVVGDGGVFVSDLN